MFVGNDSVTSTNDPPLDSRSHLLDLDGHADKVASIMITKGVRSDLFEDIDQESIGR